MKARGNQQPLILSKWGTKNMRDFQVLVRGKASFYRFHWMGLTSFYFFNFLTSDRRRKKRSIMKMTRKNRSQNRLHIQVCSTEYYVQKVPK